MKKRLGLLLSSFVIFSLAACFQPQQQEHPVSSKRSSQPILITEPLSSSSSSEEVINVSSDIQSSTTSEQQSAYYHVTFVNYDNSVLYEVDVLEGSEALYSGEDPVKEEDDEFTYEFIGWDKELTDIQSNTTFIAQFKAVAKEGWGPIIWF